MDDEGTSGRLTETAEESAELSPSSRADSQPLAASAGVQAPFAEPEPAFAEPGPTFVYALGQIEPRFPSLSLEKELAQAVAGSDNAGLTDRQVLKRAISERYNRYIARSLCWVFSIEGVETYIVVPRDPADYELLIDAYREDPRRDDLDLVIGVRGGIAEPDLCNGLALPVVIFDQLYSFDRDSLMESVPKPDSVPNKDLAKFRSAAGLMFDELTQLADNAGAIDEHRALNYLTVRYPRLYALTVEQHNRNFSFTGVDVRTSALSGARSIVDVVFAFTHRDTDIVEKYAVRVDVTHEFPFLLTKMSAYYDR
jgi:hypothetical protein